MVTLHEVITFLVSMQISISSLQTHNVNRCGRSRHLARSEERFSRNAETDLVCRLLLEKKTTRTNTSRWLCARSGHALTGGCETLPGGIPRGACRSQDRRPP